MIRKEFSKDISVDTRKPPKKRAREIAEIWGEDYEPLINVLELCIKNDVGTLACCAGHENDEIPDSYILFKADNKVSYYILECMSKDPVTDAITIDRNPISKTPSFSVHAKYEDRETFFNRIYACIQEYLRENTRNNKIKIKGINKIKNIYKRNYSDESLLKRILILTNNKYFGRLVCYEPKRKIYYFQENDIKSIYSEEEKDKKRTYSEEEIEKIYPDEFLMDKDLRENMTVIGRVKRKCLNSKFGLNKIGDLFEEFKGVIEAEIRYRKEGYVEEIENKKSEQR